MAGRHGGGDVPESSVVVPTLGWGGFAVAVAAVVVKIGGVPWLTLAWLVPVGLGLVGVAAATVWAFPPRPMPSHTDDDAPSA